MRVCVMMVELAIFQYKGIICICDITRGAVLDGRFVYIEYVERSVEVNNILTIIIIIMTIIQARTIRDIIECTIKYMCTQLRVNDDGRIISCVL